MNSCGEGFADMLIPGVSLQSQQSICGCYRDKTSHPSGKTAFKGNRREQLDNKDQRKGRSVLAGSAGKMSLKIQVDPKNINILLLAKRRKMPCTPHNPIKASGCRKFPTPEENPIPEDL